MAFWKRYGDNIKNLLGISRSQLIVSMLLLVGLVIGAATRYSNGGDRENADVLRKVLAEQLLENESRLRASITGSDTKGNTLVEPEEQEKKKEKKKDKKEIGVININTASKLELMKLPGIGDKTADKIIEQRNTAPFESPEDIMKVKGIGPKKFEKMKAHIAV